MGVYWWYILPTGLLLTMYTVTGYDASAHVAEETRDAEVSAAKGIWQSVALSALIGWFVLLAVVSIGVIALYIAYVIPVYLRWRKGDAFQQSPYWNLGNKWRWLNPIAVVWVIIISIYFCLPFYGPAAVWWDDQFDWNAANFTPLVLGVLFIAISIAWVGGMNKRYKGTIRTVEFDEGMGIKESKVLPLDPANPPTAGGSTSAGC